MRTLPLLLLLVGCSTGCHPQPIPTPLKDASPAQTATGDMALPGNEYGMATCPLTVTAVYSDICDAMFTASGLACAHCTGASECFDTVDAIYCVKGPAGCLGDTACAHVMDGTPGSPLPGRKKIKQVHPKLKRPS